jgi:glutathione S-transferase
MGMFTLYLGNRNYSSWSMRGWLAAQLAGIDAEEVVIPLAREDTQASILAVNPSGRVPALRHGDLLVWDSLAIAEYLAELYPDRVLWPAERVARARARSIAAEMHAGFPALRAALPLNLTREGDPPPLDDAVRADIARIIAIWTECRAAHARSGPWLFGEISLADAYFAPVASRFLSYRVPLDDAADAYVATIARWSAFTAWRTAARAEPWRVAKWER